MISIIIIRHYPTAYETITHVMTECRGYEDIMGWAIDEYKSILGGNDFRIKILDGEDNGVNFLLGL